MSPRAQLPLLLDSHRAALKECRDCGLVSVRPIVSEARNPRVMLVGQAPGQLEQAGGRPFAGRAGRTLFRWFESIGIDEDTVREHVYIAAITRCYPGPSASGRGDRVPSPPERERCSRWLDAEIAMIRPRLLVPVGRLAIDRFLGSLPLDRLIGEVHIVRLQHHDTRVVPLPHPSGASSWVNLPGHAELLKRALRELGKELRAAGVTGARSRGAA